MGLSVVALMRKGMVWRKVWRNAAKSFPFTACVQISPKGPLTRVSWEWGRKGGSLDAGGSLLIAGANAGGTIKCIIKLVLVIR